MGIFEKVMQERHPISENVTLTPREASATIDDEVSVRAMRGVTLDVLTTSAGPADRRPHVQSLGLLCQNDPWIDLVQEASEEPFSWRTFRQI